MQYLSCQDFDLFRYIRVNYVVMFAIQILKYFTGLDNDNLVHNQYLSVLDIIMNNIYFVNIERKIVLALKRSFFI